MEHINLRIAKELNKIAKAIIADKDYHYIYDPDHKKHPGGGYVKTEKGWQKGKQKKVSRGEQLKNHLIDIEIPKDDIPQMLEAEKYLKMECDGKPVQRQVAKKVLGDDYWHGLNRAAFHWTSARTDEDGHEWSFDCRSYFRQEQKPRQVSWKKTVRNLSTKVKRKVLQDESCPSKILDELAKDSESNIRYEVAKHPNTSPETLVKLAEDKDEGTRWYVSFNSNTPAETLEKLATDEDDYVRFGVIDNPNVSEKALSILSGDSDKNIRAAVASHPKTSTETLKKLSNDKEEEVRKEAKENLKSRSGGSLPKFKFKGDDKTQAIIRRRFEKDEDKEETDTIYGEMAQFSRDKVAPMGSYHGRTKEQLKADFIKNMNPSNYASPESFKKAQERIRKLSAQDFSRMLASIFADEEEQA